MDLCYTMLCLPYEFIFLAWSHFAFLVLFLMSREIEVKACIVTAVLNGYCNAGKYEILWLDLHES